MTRKFEENSANNSISKIRYFTSKVWETVYNWKFQFIHHTTFWLSDPQWHPNNILCSNWRAPWKKRIYWYISFFCPSLTRVLFPIFCLLVKGECQILVF